MPITVPRASVTQSADDLKARDALLRGFPEVESVIGKAGRADTPTDPAPLDMVETFVNFRPRNCGRSACCAIDDAAEQTDRVLDGLEAEGYIAVGRQLTDDRQESLINDASQKALERFDETMRELGTAAYDTRDFESKLVRELTDSRSRIDARVDSRQRDVEVAEIDR